MYSSLCDEGIALSFNLVTPTPLIAYVRWKSILQSAI